MDIIKQQPIRPAKDSKEKQSDFSVTVELSSFEASLIWHIRRHKYAVFEVTKQNGEPRLIKTISSDILKESDAYILQLEELRQKKAEETFNQDKDKHGNK